MIHATRTRRILLILSRSVMERNVEGVKAYDAAVDHRTQNITSKHTFAILFQPPNASNSFRLFMVRMKGNPRLFPCSKQLRNPKSGVRSVTKLRSRLIAGVNYTLFQKNQLLKPYVMISAGHPMCRRAYDLTEDRCDSSVVHKPVH